MTISIRKMISGAAFLSTALFGGAGIQNLSAQEVAATLSAPQLNGYFATEPWTGAPKGTASAQSLTGAPAATTIPMSTYSFATTKDGTTRTGTIVGTSPFAAPQSSTIPVVVVPLKITIGTAVFDPSAANSCDGNISAVNRFNQSPLVQVSPLTFNGVSVGTTQYINGFRRAEFWNAIGGSAAYQNTLSPVTYATQVNVPALTSSQGSTYSSGCSLLGIVSYSWFSNYLSNTLLPSLTASGVISPTKFVIFLLKNVVQSTANPPSTTGCCILGFHSAKGSPVQTYSPIDWDTTGLFSGTADGSIASHEIGEWMDDPLGTNPTPAWGNIGQVSGCQTNWENGDPLSGTLMPAITLSGKAYHMQELGFFSWYFNKLGVASLGAGGKFSANGKFAGPSKACPAGGTN